MKIFFKWLGYSVVDILLTPVAYAIAPIISIFTREEEYKDDASYSWGSIFGTYDNPPQGDEGYVATRAFFPGETKGLKGYANRVGWIWRNPLYNLQRMFAITTPKKYDLTHIGNERISDKYERPGYYLAKLHVDDKLEAFEFYCVYPWAFGKCFRARLGWKLMTDKFERYGFAPLVDTMNPFKSYGDD